MYLAPTVSPQDLGDVRSLQDLVALWLTIVLLGLLIYFYYRALSLTSTRWRESILWGAALFGWPLVALILYALYETVHYFWGG